MIGFTIFCIICSVIGVLVGTHASLVTQGITFAAFIFYLNSDFCPEELAALSPMILGACFFLGVLVGDANYYIQVHGLNFDIMNPFTIQEQ